MYRSRRNFLAAVASAAAAGAIGRPIARGADSKAPSKADLDKTLAQPGLNTEFLKRPVIGASVGLASKRPVADFFGGKLKTEIPVYYASGMRGNKPEEEIAYLQKLVGSSGAKAIKFRLGGRMNKNVDSLPGRTEALIPLVRKTFGDGMTLYADSNSSYDAKEAIRIGRIMEANGFGFYEEPCEFDDLWSTKEVADALTIPVAGGEQEFSMHRWRWGIGNSGL